MVRIIIKSQLTLTEVAQMRVVDTRSWYRVTTGWVLTTGASHNISRICV